MMISALIVGPVRALGLLKRVPELFRERGWPEHPDLVALACHAVGATKIGAGGQVLKRPAAADLHERFALLPAKVKAVEIVSHLDLGRMLDP